MKKLIAILSAVLLLFLCSASVSAATPEEELSEGLDPQAGLSDEVISDIGPYRQQEIPDFFQTLWNLVRNALSDSNLLGLKSGIRVLGLLLCTVLLTGLMDPGEGKNQYSAMVGCLVITGACGENLYGMIRLGTETVTNIHDYFRLLMPGMGTLIFASGGVTGSAALTSGALLVFDGILAVLSGLLVPLLYLQIGLSCGESVLGLGSLEKLRDFVKWCATALIKGVMYGFSACLTATGVFSGAVDAHKLKTVRMAISGTIPVVGGIVSDASQSLLTAAGILRTSVGLYGLLAVLGVCLRPFLQIWLQYFLLKLATATCGLLGKNRQVALIEQMTEIMGTVLAAVGISCILGLLAISLCIKAVPV